MNKAQFRQTIISTGAVGAVFGILPVLGAFAWRSEYSRNPGPPPSLFSLAFDLGLVFIASVAFCILFFGLLPMAVQHCFVWAVRRWTGRA
ncbi:MAG: hypothetical protein KF800_09825 [Lysobacter sp.]|nr:hypothetical protein [Lysobacter sp.]